MFLIFKIILETLASQPMRTVQHNVMLRCCIYSVQKTSLNWFLITSLEAISHKLDFYILLITNIFTIFLSRILIYSFTRFPRNSWIYYIIISLKIYINLLNTVYIFHSIWLVCQRLCMLWLYIMCTRENIPSVKKLRHISSNIVVSRCTLY